MATPGVETDSLDERMEDTSYGTAPAGTSSGGSAIAPGDGTPASPGFGLTAGSPPETGQVVPREALGRWFYPAWPLYEEGLTVLLCGRLGAAMGRVWDRLREKYPRRVGFPAGFRTDQFAFLDDEEVEDVQRAKAMVDRGGTIPGPGDLPTFTWDTVATRPPYLHEADPHTHHFDVRMEKDFRRGPYLVTSAQLEFPQQSAASKEQYYPKKPEWRPQVEVPYGFPALLPRLLDHFGSVMLTAGPDHLVWAMLATQWLLEVMSTWVSCVQRRVMLWHLPLRLIQGLEQLTPQLVAEGCSSGQLTLLEEMLRLHKFIEWESIEHKLRRPTRGPKDDGALCQFVWVVRELHEGRVVLREGLGIGDYPYAPGVDRHTAPPPDKAIVMAVPSYDDHMTQPTAGAPSRGRSYTRVPPPRRAPPLPPVPYQPHGDIPISVAVESSTPVSPNLGATLLTVYPKLVLPPTPLTSEMMITTLVRTISWLAASTATLQTSETPQLEERVRTAVAAASCESVAELMTAELARIGAIMPQPAPLGRGKRRASRAYSPPRRRRRHSRRSPSVSEDELSYSVSESSTPSESE